MKSDFGLHWFRRDLRIAGNPALLKNLEANSGRVVGLFSFDQTFLDRPDFSANRFQFFLETLKSLREEMQKLGGDLLVLDQGPAKVFPYILKKMKSPPDMVTWNRDYEPFAVKRDAEMAKLLEEFGIHVETERDHLIIEPHELAKDESGKDGYQVYGAFSRKWREIYAGPGFHDRIEAQNEGLKYLEGKSKGPKFYLSWKDLVPTSVLKEDALEEYLKANAKHVKIKIPAAGSKAALKHLDSFADRLDEYKTARDIPSIPGTSQLSIYLKNGSLTTSQIIARLKLRSFSKKPSSSREVYFSQLIWREFYFHVLYRHPRVEKEAFLQKYKNVKWKTDKKFLKAWIEGKTGFPIVDAGMRQLQETGWMHNRVRMIVASFLTKDLHINWQDGELHFMNLLLDGDLAENNGGWQWAASTGTDPQPYFRIFNPWRQSERFDPTGDYIRKYVPELKDLKDKDLHKPILNHKTYPEPIVDHSKQSKEAIKMYKAAR